MAPKSKKGAGGGAQRSRTFEDDREEPLQAVVLADSYETRFRPFTLEKPRCLLTLANTPLIEYTLEFLANSGVEEVFLYCGNHTEAVEEYLQASKWTKKTSPFALEIVRSSAKSAGDVMRDLDQKDLITGDFLVVYGDVVANVSLEEPLAAHRARREKDKKCIMTMVLREVGENHRTKAKVARPCFVLDAKDERCVHFEEVRQGEAPRLALADEVLKDCVEMEVREDLIDCGIDICTPEVLGQWSDNFDWQQPRKGLLSGVIKDYDTMQLKIYAHILTDGYAARVHNLQSYDAISRDIMHRWTYPLTPDINLLPDQFYHLEKGSIYKEDDVVLAYGSKIEKNVIIGRATSVGAGSVIRNSVIGRRCVIGKNVTIEGAYIWDDARIGDGSEVISSVVGNEASIGKGCNILDGTLLSYGVTVANEKRLWDRLRITRFKKKSDETEDLVRGKTDTRLVGEAGEGFILAVDEEEEDAHDLSLTLDHIEIDDSISVSTMGSEDEEEDERYRARHERSSSFGSEEGDEARARSMEFYHEAVNSVFDAMQNKVDPDTINVELRSLRMASNVEDRWVRRAVAVAFTKRIATLMEDGSSPKEAVDATIPPNQLLVKACVSLRAKDKDAEVEQAKFMLFLQNDLLHRPQGSKVLLYASNSLATKDLIEAEGFEKWWNDPKSSATDDLEKVRAETEALVKVMVGDDSEEEEEESEEEEDDEGEEESD